MERVGDQESEHWRLDWDISFLVLNKGSGYDLYELCEHSMFTFFVEAVFKLTKVSYALYKKQSLPITAPCQAPSVQRSGSLWGQPSNWLLISEHLERCFFKADQDCEGLKKKNSGRKVNYQCLELTPTPSTLSFLTCGGDRSGVQTCPAILTHPSDVMWC